MNNAKGEHDMKKLLLLALVAFIALAGVAVASDYKTTDPTIRKYMWYGETAGGVPAKIQVEADGTVVTSGGSGGTSVFTETADGAYLDGDVTVTGLMEAITINTGQGANELYTMNQDVESSDAVVFATVNTGQGANELFDMDQNVLEASAVTFATVNTGQGVNELYAMNQDVESSDSVTFAAITATGAITVGGSGTEGVIIMPDSGATDHDLTIGTNDKIYIDGAEYASGAITVGGTVTYVTSITDDFVVGGTTLANGALSFDESAGALTIDGPLTTGGLVTIQGNTLIDGDLSVNNKLLVSDLQGYIYLQMTADDTSVSATNSLNFVKSSGTLAHNDTTFKTTLLAGRTYRGFCDMRANFSASGTLTCQWWNDTDSEQVTDSSTNKVYAVSGTSAQGSNTSLGFLVTPTTNIDIYLRVSANSNCTSIFAVDTEAFIQEII